MLAGWGLKCIRQIEGTGFIWLSLRTIDDLLLMWYWTVGFHKMWGISWLAEKLLASLEGLCSMELVTYYRVSIKYFPDYKHLLQGTLRCTSVRRVSAVDNFPSRFVHLHTGVHMLVGFWMQHFQTRGLCEMVWHPGHPDRRISPPWLLFMGAC